MRGDDRSRASSALGAVALLLVAAGCSTRAAAGRRQAAEGDAGGARASVAASLFPICVGARFGFVDRTGAVVVPPELGMIDETIGELTQVWVLLPVPPGEEQPGLPPPGRAGFVDTRGRFAVEPVYEDAHPFSDGLAAVKREGRWGYVDGRGKIRIPLRYGSAAPFSDGLALVEDDAGQQRTLSVPISATVGRALSGPAEIAFEVNAATDEAALSAARATVTTATQAALQLTAQADVLWVVPTDVATGPADNLALSFPRAEIAALGSGVHTGTVTLTPTAPNVQPLTVPVRLTVRLPEVNFVAPVAFTDTADTDYVIARGAGLADAAATLRVDGVPVTGATVVSDSEVRFVPGAHGAGDHVVDAPNALGLERGTATLRIVDPPPYAAATLSASLGLQDRVVPMSSGGIVFTALSLNGSVVSGGTSSTVQRFLLDADTGAWTRTQFNYPDLADIALTPDESHLVVLTRTDLRLVDPRTMATATTIALPAQIAGGSRQLAVTNDGLLLVQELGKAYSLQERQFVPIAGLTLHMGLGGSRDGSRVFFGDANNFAGNPYRYYDASTGAVVLTQTFKHFSRGVYSRHAERALANGYLCDGDLTFLGDLPVDSHTGDLSPDGRRAYGYSSGQLKVVDIADPQQITELTPITVTNYGVGRMAVEPRGRFGFVAAQNGFIVVDLR